MPQSEYLTFGLDGPSGNDDFDPWSVSEVSFWALTVVQGAVTNGATGRSESEAPIVKKISTPISIFGGLVNNLIEGREDVVCELNLCKWIKRNVIVMMCLTQQGGNYHIM